MIGLVVVNVLQFGLHYRSFCLTRRRGPVSPPSLCLRGTRTSVHTCMHILNYAYLQQVDSSFPFGQFNLASFNTRVFLGFSVGDDKFGV